LLSRRRNLSRFFNFSAVATKSSLPPSDPEHGCEFCDESFLLKSSLQHHRLSCHNVEANVADARILWGDEKIFREFPRVVLERLNQLINLLNFLIWTKLCKCQNCDLCIKGWLGVAIIKGKIGFQSIPLDGSIELAHVLKSSSNSNDLKSLQQF
jgi:hypothetical protein